MLSVFILVLSFFTSSVSQASSSDRNFSAQDDYHVGERIFVTNVDEGVFDRFIRNSKIGKIKVVDSFGKVVENKISSTIKDNLLSEKNNFVLDLLKEHDLSLQYATESVIGIHSNESIVERDLHEYHLKTDLSGKHTKEWTTIMNVRYRENSNGTFTALRNPIVSVVANFGAAWEPIVSLKNSGYDYLNNRRSIRFSSNYRMQGRYRIPIGSFDFIIKTYDFGKTWSSGIIR